MALLAVVAMLAAGGCAGTPKPTVARTLVANILAEPRGTIGLVLADYSSPTPTAFRALGIPFRAIPLAQATTADFSVFQTVMLDEDALSADKGYAAYGSLIEAVKKHGLTLVVLRQTTELLAKASRVLPYQLSPRDVEFQLTLATPRRTDPMMRAPNEIGREDLDSMSRQTRQLATGGPDSRAIISANLVSPDASAALLWEPFHNGAVWYVSFPITARAAAGRVAEQKLLANLASNK